MRDAWRPRLELKRHYQYRILKRGPDLDSILMKGSNAPMLGTEAK